MDYLRPSFSSKNEDSDVLNHIHQSIISLSGEISFNEVEIILNKTFIYIDKDLENSFINELFSLIYTCFSKYPNELLPILNIFVEKSKSNSSYIIITFSILSYYMQINCTLPDHEYITFINDSRNHLLSQLQNSSKTQFSIFNHQIPSQFELQLILDILLCSKLTEPIIRSFIPYILSQKNYQFFDLNKERLARFVHEIIQLGFNDLVIDHLPLNNDFYSYLYIDDFIILIPLLSNQIFTQIFSQIEKVLINSTEISSTLISIVIQKCKEQNLKLQINSIENLFNLLLTNGFTSETLAYFKNYDYVFQIKNGEKLNDFPDPFYLLKITRNLEILPKNLLSKGLLESTDINFYKRVFQSNTHLSDVLVTSEFYIHIYSLLTSQDIESNSQIIKDFSNFFQIKVTKEKSQKIITDMIFSVYPPNQQQIKFLNDFIQFLKSDYFNGFDEPTLMNNLIDKIIETKIIPHYSFMNFFKSIYIGNLLNSLLLKPNPKINSNPIIKSFLQYALKFSKGKVYDGFIFNTITINLNTKIDLNDSNLSTFINENNFDLLTKLDSNSLLLASNALNFAESCIIQKINGLTKETILPFYSIVLRNWDKDFNSVLFESNSISNLFFESFKSMINDKSPVIKSSFNSILNCKEPLKINGFKNMQTKMLSVLYESLLKDDYCADKTILISYLIMNINSLKTIKNDLNDFVPLIIKYFPEINFKSINCKLNLTHFNSQKVSTFLTNIIENSESSDEFINTLYFISNMCINLPELKINNCDNLVKFLLAEKELENIFLIANCFINFGFLNELRGLSLPDEIYNQILNYIPFKDKTYDEIISSILMNENLENDDDFLNSLFTKFMSNDKINELYYDIVAQSIKYDGKIQPEKIHQQCSDEYKRNPIQFFKSLDKIYVFHEQSKSFIQRAEIKESNFDFKDFESELTFIKKLFDNINEVNSNCYKIFFCLKSLACSFPFLFEQDPDFIFNTVLPKLENYSILFDDKVDSENKEIEDKAKTTITAFSFLISTLHSIKIIDAFIIWYFNNFDRFSNIQIYCFNSIFQSILKKYGFKHVLFSSFLKYNYIDKINDLLKRDVPEGVFRNNYIKVLYSILNSYYSSINKYSNIEVVAIDELCKDKTPFATEFKNCLTIYPFTFRNFREKKNKKSPKTKFHEKNLNFKKNINKSRTFWLNKPKNSIQNSNKTDVNELIQNYKKIIKINDNNNNKTKKLKVLKVLKPLTVEMARFALHQPRWVFKWILDDIQIPIYSEHYKILRETISELNKIKKDHEFNYELLINFDIELYFKSQYKQSDLFNTLVNNAFSLSSSLNDKVFSKLTSLIEKIGQNKRVLKNILAIISNNFDLLKEKRINDENKIKLIDRIISILSSISNCKGFKNNFEKCEVKLIDLFLEPQYRTNEKMLLKLFNFFNDIDLDKATNNMTYFVSFMILTKKENLILNALKLCSKYHIHNFEVIENLFIKEMQKEDPSLLIMSKTLDLITFIDKSHQKDLTLLLDKLFNRIQNEKVKDKIMNDLINKLLNLLTPSRNITDTFDLNDLPNQQKNSMQPIPQNIYESDPLFWSLFERNRTVINNLIENQRIEFLNENEEEEENFEEEEEENEKQKLLKIKLLNEFPEFFSFDLRYKIFQQKMHLRINNIIPLCLLIDKENILESSFNQLNDKTPSQWKRRIEIEFINNKGVDFSGLRRDWFTNLSKELFNPDYGLFSSTDQVSFQPSRLSYANPDHLKFFKFAGMIIARALLQGENVDVHLSRPFLKQILHRKVELKDIEDSDEMIFKSLQFILDNDIDNDEYNEYYFDVDKDDYGVRRTYEFIENGSEIKVTNDNKSEFVQLMVNYHSRDSIEQQIKAFCDGFDAIVPHNEIKIFTPIELDLLICGLPEIDVDELKKNAKCVLPLTKESPSVKLFFDSIAKWNNSNLEKLLMFITGSPKVPGNGFRKIKIQPGGDKNRLPVAHTCFNTIDLPEYETEDELNSKFMIAIDEKSFQLA